MSTNFWKDLERPFFVLAPMEAVTDVVFRHVVARAGAPDIYFTEFANATGWVHAGDKAIRGRLVKTDDEHPLVAQIWGGEPGDMEAFARHCDELGYDGIDINMGCPAKSAVKSGGSALIRKPDVAVAAIAAAKTAGLPVSVKTRLGYTSTDEWRDWLTTLLRQDIAALTIHLRTKREMSKVPAHYELIPAIKQLRDEIAPETLLIINGDIRDRAHGLELVERYGVDGIMIGRGIFANPFAFKNLDNSNERVALGGEYTVEVPGSNLFPEALTPSPDASPETRDSGKTVTVQNLTSETYSGERATLGGAAPTFDKISDFSKEGADRATGPADKRSYVASTVSTSVRREREDDGIDNSRHKQQLLSLLNYHLDLFDQYQPELGRPFETLKRFFKIYIRDFDGASDLREKLMHCNSTDEVRTLINN